MMMLWARRQLQVDNNEEWPMVKRIPMTDVSVGTTAKVVEILGGHSVTARLHSIGIRSGVTVRKVSGFANHGPAVLQVGGTQTALGYGVCSKIIVEEGS